jgi:hypothetical protein
LLPRQHVRLRSLFGELTEEQLSSPPAPQSHGRQGDNESGRHGHEEIAERGKADLLVGVPPAVIKSVFRSSPPIVQARRALVEEGAAANGFAVTGPAPDAWQLLDTRGRLF